jgi:type IV secretion system protein VirB2
LALLLAVSCIPLAAHAQDIAPVSSTLTAIHGFLQSTAIRTLAAIAVIGVGITAMLGRMRWAWAGSVIGGIVLIFGADQFVSFFTTSAGG